MTGRLTVVGLGPGNPEFTTPAVTHALNQATDLVGYGPYLDRLGTRDDQHCHPTGNRIEIERARHALELADNGRRVVVVSSGDPGVFAMAAAIFEAIESGPNNWQNIEIQVEPGITAMLSAAAHVGAPLGADFCAISLSDNLKNWQTIEKRLVAAAQADFVIALYNPASKARPNQLGQAIDLLRKQKSQQTIVVLARAVGTPDATLTTTTLNDMDVTAADMRTLVIIGSSRTRVIPRNGSTPWVYTPRSEREVA